MPLDPTIKAILDSTGGGMIPAESMPVADLRAMVRQYSVRETPLPVTLADVSDRRIPGPAGEVAIRMYTPVGNAPFPAIVYFHGGGFVLGDLDTEDMICRGLCAASGCRVFSVDYRLAPEHKFPAAVDDACAAVLWVRDNAAELNIDPNRIAVGGGSAGATLSASVSLRLRDADQDFLKGQIMFYGSMEYNKLGSTPSMVEFEQGPIISGQDVKFFWSQYLPSLDDRDPYAQPMIAESHAGLPPAFLATGECDPLRDSGEAYGAKLEAAGVPTTVKRYRGMPHGFISWLGVVDGAQAAIDDASTWLHKQFARTAK